MTTCKPRVSISARALRYHHRKRTHSLAITTIQASPYHTHDSCANDNIVLSERRDLLFSSGVRCEFLRGAAFHGHRDSGRSAVRQLRRSGGREDLVRNSHHRYTSGEENYLVEVERDWMGTFVTEGKGIRWASLLLLLLLLPRA